MVLGGLIRRRFGLGWIVWGLGIGSVLDKAQGWIRFGDGLGAQLDFRVDTVQGWIRLRMD